MKTLTREDIRLTHKGGDLWESWITDAPRAPGSRKPVRRTVHAETEDEARDAAFEAFATVYPVLMVSGAVDFKTAVSLCVDKRREIGQIKSDKTARDYKRLVERSLKGLPKTPVDEVDKSWLETLYGKLHSSGGKHGRGVSVKTLRKLNVVIKGSYEYMNDHGARLVNPAIGVKFPKPSDDEVSPPRAFTEAEWAAFQDAVTGALAEEARSAAEIKRKSALFGSYVAMYTGIRRGEVCGLRRGDVRMLDGVIRIVRSVTDDEQVKPPKTRKSMRTIVMGEELKDAIREFYRWQASFLSEKQRRSDDTPLCCDASGAILRPQYVSEQFKVLCKKAGIELGKGESIHTLRHTHVSELLTSGVSVKAVQERAGHASAATTLDYYAHVMPGEDAAVAASFDGLAERARKEGGLR